MPTIVRTFDRTLMRPLTPDEKADLAQRLAETRIKVEGVENDKAAANATYNASIKALDALSLDLAKRYEAGADADAVSCTEEADEIHGELRIRRLDTGVLIEARTMTCDELAHYRQMTLPLDGAPADAPPAVEVLPLASLLDGHVTGCPRPTEVSVSDDGVWAVRCGVCHVSAMVTLEQLANVRRADLVKPWAPVELAEALHFDIPREPTDADQVSAPDAPADAPYAQDLLRSFFPAEHRVVCGQGVTYSPDDAHGMAVLRCACGAIAEVRASRLPGVAPEPIAEQAAVPAGPPEDAPTKPARKARKAKAAQVEGER